jgi:hypothetical protein
MSIFHPEKSIITHSALIDFRRTEFIGDLLEIPGIGVETVLYFKKVGIYDTFQLIEKYLMFKEHNISRIEHAQNFYKWLMLIGLSKKKSNNIVHAISTKMNVTFPGIYDPYEYKHNNNNVTTYII